MELYIEAAAVLRKFEDKQGSAKSLVFASEYKNVRQLYALVCESLKYQPVLTTIFERCQSLQQEVTLQGQGHLATVLLYDHLVGKGLGRAGQIRNCIVKHKHEIQEKCNELLEERGVTSLADLLSSQCQALNKLPIPRYARVNLLKTTVEDAVAAFSYEGWIWQGALDLQNFQRDVESLGEEGFAVDPMLPDVLIFPPGTDLHDHALVAGGRVVLQDRASCFPVHILNPERGATVLDCCAAPGNKTSHAASLMENSGKIWAYERDAKRMSLLQQQLRKNGVTNVKTVHQDFLSVDPYDQQFADVEFILVDPSCSGSGIISRMDHVTTNSSIKSTQRLLSLQRFQISILKHALKFPAARRVVYSTCSVYEEENEKVVGEVAQQVQDKFQVTTIFPQFSHRGKGSEELAKKCVRMSPKKDLTNGFFVACFERLSREAEAGDVEMGTSEETCELGTRDSMEMSPKKNRKRKTMEESESIDAFGSSVDTTSSQLLVNGAETASLRKKRGKKHREDSNSGDTVNDSNLPFVDTGSSQNGEQELETLVSPKKKKKHKSKKRIKNESGGTETVKKNGSLETEELLNASDVSSTRGGIATTKCKTTKIGKKNEIAYQPESAQTGQQPNATTDTSISENAATKKKKKKKKNKKADKQENSLCSHTQIKESDSPSLTSEFTAGETTVEKKKKEQYLQVEEAILEHGEESLSPSLSQDTNQFNNPEKQDSDTKRRKKKKERLQVHEVTAEDRKNSITTLQEQDSNLSPNSNKLGSVCRKKKRKEKKE